MINEQWLAAQLKARGLLTEAQVQAAVSGKSDDFCLNLLATGAITEAELLKLLSLHFQTRYVGSEKLSKAKISQAVLNSVPAELCEQLCALPVKYDKQNKILSVVAPDPSDSKIRDLLKQHSEALEVHIYVALRHSVEAAIRKWYKGDIHAFARAEQTMHQTYSRMLDIYDQRVIDLGEISSDAESLELADDASSGHGSQSVPTAPPPPPPPKRLDKSSYENKEAARGASEHKTGDLEKLVSSTTTSLSAANALSISDIQIATETHVQTIATLINLLEMNTGWRQGHSAEVARLVEILGHRLGLVAQDIFNLRVAAFLHELGKPVEPHLTLLSLNESSENRSLASRVYQSPLKLLETAKLPKQIIAALNAQYERPDGKGIPGKLSGHEIPLLPRLLSVVDVFCDLMSNPKAPGGQTKEQGDALRRLREEASKKSLDANAVDIFCQVTTGDALRIQLLGERRRVMVIDPDAESTTVLELKLVAAGFDVRIVRNTAEAAREVLGINVDLILSEVTLEPVDGFGFLKRIRSDSRTRAIPLIFVSERSDPSELNRGFELGASDYIVKPYNPDLLLAKIKRLLEKRPPARGSRGVTGSLHEMSLPDLIQILSTGQKSGLLYVRLPNGTGKIYLEKGQVVHAIYGELKGEEALYQLIPVTEGEFSLEPDVKTPDRTIDMSTESLLLESMRRFDESSRNSNIDRG